MKPREINKLDYGFIAGLVLGAVLATVIGLIMTTPNPVFTCELITYSDPNGLPRTEDGALSLHRMYVYKTCLEVDGEEVEFTSHAIAEVDMKFPLYGNGFEN